MAIDMLNINWNAIEAEKSSFYYNRNGCHGLVTNIPPLLDLHGSRLLNRGRASALGSSPR